MMAKKQTGKSDGGAPKGSKKSDDKGRSTAVTRVASNDSGDEPELDGIGDAFIKLLQSPLVAELVAVAATAALAALAEQGFSNRGGGGGTTGKRAGRAVKTAGAAAAAAVGRRLNTEIEEIRRAAKESKGGAKG
jgi:hypothetical protein